jgi:hypothetical protein
MALVGYVFFPLDQGHGWGNRYFHSAWMALPLLATAALFRPVDADRAAAEPVPGGSRLFEDMQTRTYVTACILLSLVLGVGVRAQAMRAFMAFDVGQLPQYRGTEKHVVLLVYNVTFYGADLVQNDPWLRGNEIRMLSHDPASDAQMMAQNYPTMHKVYADHHSWVWSAAPSAHDVRHH